MAPKVQVPANFGIEHLGLPSHSNLTLTQKGGVERKVNSMIMSANSPTIDRLTTQLHQTSIDFEDFALDAVDGFVVAMYTGEAEKLNLQNFRDINKMSWVFQVSWLQVKCSEYFREHVYIKVDFRNYEAVLYVVEEARFAWEKLKQCQFLADVRDEFFVTPIGFKSDFIERYLADFSACSKDQFNMMIEIAGDDVDILVKVLNTHLVLQSGNLDENTNYLLQNMDLSKCFEKDRTLADRLFNLLEEVENISTEDLKMIFGLYKNAMKTSSVGTEIALSDTFVKFPNLFNSFAVLRSLHFEELLKKLAASSKVTNLYMFIEAVYVWLSEAGEEFNEYSTNLNRLEKMINIKEERGWNSVSRTFVGTLLSSGHTFKFCASSEFMAMVLNSVLVNGRTRLLVPPSNYHNNLIYGYPCNLTFQTFFEKHNKIKFVISDTVCMRRGRCGFVLIITPSKKTKPQSFNIKLSTDPKDYSDDIHLHDDVVSADKLHVMLTNSNPDCNPDGAGKTQHIPLTWCGKPKWHKAPNKCGHWTWGPYKWTWDVIEHHGRTLENGATDRRTGAWKQTYNLCCKMKFGLVVFYMNDKKRRCSIVNNSGA